MESFDNLENFINSAFILSSSLNKLNTTRYIQKQYPKKLLYIIPSPIHPFFVQYYVAIILRLHSSGLAFYGIIDNNQVYITFNMQLILVFKFISHEINDNNNTTVTELYLNNVTIYACSDKKINEFEYAFNCMKPLKMIHNNINMI
jgi:hypothetical protein